MNPSHDDCQHSQMLKQIKEDMIQLKNEENLIDHHTEYVQNLLKAMSEHESNRKLVYFKYFYRYTILFT